MQKRKKERKKELENMFTVYLLQKTSKNAPMHATGGEVCIFHKKNNKERSV